MSKREEPAPFSGVVALVTGGSRGLGFAIARELAASNEVIVCGRDAATLDRARAALAAEGRTIETAACDVADREAVERLVERIVATRGRIDLAINAAGIIEVGPLADQTEADYAEAIATHLYGPLHVTSAVAPVMRARGGGHVVNVASIGGVVGVPHLAPYAASKFALVGFSQAAGAELARDGIKVTCVCPGLMRTGSPDHATFKGRNLAEYAWFAISDANPLLSMDAGVAAHRILAAAARGTPVLLLSPFTRIGAALNGLAPNFVSHALRLAAAWLPRPGGIGTARRTGAESHSAIAPSPLTALDRAAVARYNQA
jgi:NAD(P)-dependent dehydrogenase (short-subunit alcohol dehydrogenase family)